MARPMRSPQSDYSRVVALCLLIWQAVLSDRHDRHLVLHFAHGDGQAHTRSTTDDVGHDDGLANGCKPPVLSALESAAARTRVRRFRRSAVRRLLCGDDGPTRIAARYLCPVAAARLFPALYRR